MIVYLLEVLVELGSFCVCVCVFVFVCVCVCVCVCLSQGDTGEQGFPGSLGMFGPKVSARSHNSQALPHPFSGCRGVTPGRSPLDESTASYARSATSTLCWRLICPYLDRWSKRQSRNQMVQLLPDCFAETCKHSCWCSWVFCVFFQNTKLYLRILRNCHVWWFPFNKQGCRLKFFGSAGGIRSVQPLTVLQCGWCPQHSGNLERAAVFRIETTYNTLGTHSSNTLFLGCGGGGEISLILSTAVKKQMCCFLGSPGWHRASRDTGAEGPARSESKQNRLSTSHAHTRTRRTDTHKHHTHTHTHMEL